MCIDKNLPLMCSVTDIAINTHTPISPPAWAVKYTDCISEEKSVRTYQRVSWI